MKTEKTGTCVLIPNTSEVKHYGCGHDGPTKWGFDLFGKKFNVSDERLLDAGKCGQCHLDELVPQLTQCAKCETPILPGQACIIYEAELCCLGLDCGPGPAFAMPGIWDGKNFVDGITAGTVRVISQPKKK